MSKLSEWVEQNTTLTQKKFDENDITTNAKIRKMFFEQIENLEFSFKKNVSQKSTFRTNGEEYLISLRLDFPRKTEAPYTFLFNSEKLTVIPQYTATHRVYRPVNDDERETLTNLGFYIESNDNNKDKSNPLNRRDRSKNFFEKSGIVENDVIMFTLGDDDMNADGCMVIKYLDEGREYIVAYQANESDFTVSTEFRNIRIHRQLFNNTSDSSNTPEKYIYVYNYPENTDPHSYVLTARY